MLRAASTLCVALFGAGFTYADPPPKDTAAHTDFFERRIRPVLAEHCFSCHGPKKQQGGLRLDSRAGMMDGIDGAPVIVPGHPEKSLLLRAIRHEGPQKMPPKGKLSAQAVADLADWVKLGAPWPAATATAKSGDDWKKHWAFQPVRPPALPAVKNEAWPINPIDRFVLARLEAKGLTPSPAADRRTLIRRASYDLLGLPPSPEEVAAFQADPDPRAYEKLIDRLLASPHYGERGARHWLDVARYADTKGYVFFEEHDFTWAYTYRDYVIRSFNEDKPYDRFILEQLAADRLDLGEDRRPLTALGFLTLGGRFMNNQHDILDDRIDVVTRGLLGLTVTCARCHDHKYDPIPAKDYYALYGVFASSAEPQVPPLFEPPPATEEYAKFDKELKEREKKLTDFVRDKHQELVRGARRRAAEYMLAAHALRDQPSTDDFMLIAEGNDLNPTMIARWQAYLTRKAKMHDPVFAPWHALAKIPEKDFPQHVAQTLTDLLQDAKQPVNPLVAKALREGTIKSMGELAQRYGQVLDAVDKKWQEAQSKEKPPPAALSDPAEEQVRRVFYGPDSPADVALLPYGDLSLLPDRASQAVLQKYRKDLETHRSGGKGAPPRALVLEDLPTPQEPRVFLRGNPNNLGESVPRRFPQVLAGDQRRPFTNGSGRLELAKAIIDPANPLTARVLVNRLWLNHMGAGLVRTPSDFGLRSEPPSHPELLDWLALYFMHSEPGTEPGALAPGVAGPDNAAAGHQGVNTPRSGAWSVKKMHRLIMLSQTYRQQSHDRPDGKALDPENVLLWKMNRRRLDFESLRDTLLVAAGRLDRTIGGPSVKDIAAPQSTRRTFYGFLDRLNLPPLYRTFDFPSPDATSPQRDPTTVAPQALFLMNHPLPRECARQLAQRKDVAAEKDTAGKVTRLYRILFGRAPSGVELILARDYLGENPTPSVWTQFSQALLLTNEMMFVD